MGGFKRSITALPILYAETSPPRRLHVTRCGDRCGENVPVAARVTAAYCSDIGGHAAEEAVQVLGGIGMAWEHPTHLHLKMARADEIAFGTAGAHRAVLAGLVDLNEAHKW